MYIFCYNFKKVQKTGIFNDISTLALLCHKSVAASGLGAKSKNTAD